ncbi:hypothetical protein HETIRDRAFT_118789 [Heterobasidion irregulare TC 32-1]|uniref:Uncharacterized protein n=1 Tax=Heterobasidion irregulare (strain TC 32-1) TaxID=747525 RepID=W4JSD9_HETIT|nr:uncharacterized protein HETIRDRAFT_118789 [Heterobasidion irregulare TC 32-1]ETW76482.1 hypothetical protein HETIRDRAFT_118789 [Heterobasidion irregulare TC 32-1]
MSQQRSQHFDAIIQQLDAPTSNVRKMVDYLLGNKWELIDAATANALMYQLPFFETFFRDYIFSNRFDTQDRYGGLRGRLHDLFDGATIKEIQVWLKKRDSTASKARALAIFSCRIINANRNPRQLITWMLEKGNTQQLNGFTNNALNSLSGLMNEFLWKYSSKRIQRTPFKAMAELPDITPNYCTDLFKPMISGPLPPYMESRSRQVSAYAANGRKTQMVGYIGQIGLVFGCFKLQVPRPKLRRKSRHCFGKNYIEGFMNTLEATSHIQPLSGAHGFEMKQNVVLARDKRKKQMGEFRERPRSKTRASVPISLEQSSRFRDSLISVSSSRSEALELE